MVKLLMTRPKGDAERFVTNLPSGLRHKLTPIFSPLVEIQPAVSDLNLAGARGLIFTSANGVLVAAGLTDQRDLPCFCVGSATTQAAVYAGWKAQCVGTDAESLIKSLHQFRPVGPLLHIRGACSRGNVSRRLTKLGCPTLEQIVYDQHLLPLSETAQALLRGTEPVIVPLFSPRTARQFANQNTGQAPLYLAVLSDAVADQVKSLKCMKLDISREPTADAMAKLVEHLVNTVERVEGGKAAQ
jgi:uroporphyrinogen-III synthase